MIYSYVEASRASSFAAQHSPQQYSKNQKAQLHPQKSDARANFADVYKESIDDIIVFINPLTF